MKVLNNGDGEVKFSSPKKIWRHTSAAVNCYSSSENKTLLAIFFLGILFQQILCRLYMMWMWKMCYTWLSGLKNKDYMKRKMFEYLYNGI